MKLLVANLTGGGLSGGYVKYLNKLLPLLQADTRISKLDVFVPAPSVSRVNFRVHPLEMRAMLPYRGLGCRFKELRPDVVFIPMAHWVDCGEIPTVVMFHNMEPLVAPFRGNPISECGKNLGRMVLARRASRHATRVIAVSEFVRNFLTTEWKVPASTIGVVYHGMEAPMSPQEAAAPGILRDLQRPFFFTAGSIRPARGLEDAVRALVHLPALRDHLLVVAGVAPAPLTYQQQVTATARRLGVVDRLIWAGHLTPPEMSWCYYHCAAFIMTSRVEACPITVLEAMAHGCPCVSTNCPPMPEFFGDSALYYSPGDAFQLADRLGHLRDSQDEASRLRRRTVERALLFSWERTASRTIEEIQSALH